MGKIEYHMRSFCYTTKNRSAS